MLPDMVPIAILGSAVYLVRPNRLPHAFFARFSPDGCLLSQGLRLLQANLSHERYLEEAIAKVAGLEAEVELLRAQSQAKAVQPVEILSPHGEANKRGWFW